MSRTLSSPREGVGVDKYRLRGTPMRTANAGGLWGEGQGGQVKLPKLRQKANDLIDTIEGGDDVELAVAFDMFLNTIARMGWMKERTRRILLQTVRGAVIPEPDIEIPEAFKDAFKDENDK